LFTSFMRCPDDIASTQLSAMVQRLEREVSAGEMSDDSSSLQLKSLLLRLHSQYPGDRGVFCPLIMNYLQLKSGESFFIGANEPHAYISGDCVECMALSDNVVRAGLTPKFKDIETLCGMLNYRCHICSCKYVSFRYLLLCYVWLALGSHPC
jgi:mannose-6-phosphate isomerase